ncbi:hypothetical protein P8C59_003184 [Phyllachora maydis]|uniref:Chitin synthase n=1 Tax=Phyllachora maydis TaxID=1825666 RepID=A0AAD9MB69_9PEZI|nr:hypothetical protein P8C59_003184 [Phyllachora maydis]
MAYNRLDNSHLEKDPAMDPRAHRTPSPAHPLQHGYQLDDNPYGHSQQNLDIPMGPGRYSPGDALQMQTAQSVENLSGGYHDAGYHQEGHYGVSPEEHHDAYYSAPYEPPITENDGFQAGTPQGFEYDDLRPMLQHNDSQAAGPDPYYAQPQRGGGGIRRWKTVKQVLLYRGNLVLDCPIPPKLLNQLPHGERDEFTHMRYTAATCDPSNFYEESFTLRQKLFSKPRHTELFIVVTMYNEDEILFARTMQGVFKNVEYMCKRNESKTWGKDAWKKIVVCVVSDGRAKINSRTRALLAGMGVYQEGIAKQQVNNKDVESHIYEYTTQVGLSIKNDTVQLIPKQQPVQMLFCLKEKNQKKINSHRWFFQAFGRVLDPNICVLIDAGTKPGNNSIYHLWKAFDLEPMCAGACGEIKAMLGPAGKNLLNPIVSTQNFEYKMSNILDKPMESAFGFISVLPGAFSAYRYVALQNDKNGQGPLEKTYVKSATGETDVPDTVTELILQRRRWLNGSFFAAIYAIAHFYEFFRSDHSILRKFAFFIEFVFNTINMIFAWFAIGNFFLVFKILTTSLGDSNLLGSVGSILGVVFEWLYGVSLITCFVLAMGNRPAGSGPYYMAMVIFWAIIFIYLMFAAIFIAVKAIQTDVAQGFNINALFKNPVFYTLIVSVMSTYGIWFIASLLMFDPWHMLTSMVQYMLLTPTYINILNVYAFCNTHDISWGTKGDDKPEKLPSVTTKDGQGKTDLPDEGDLNAQYERELSVYAHKSVKEVKTPTPTMLAEKQMDYYRGVRTVVVLAWMITNFALCALVLSTAGLEKITSQTGTAEETQSARATIYMAVVLWSVAALSAFKFIGAMWFLIVLADGWLDAGAARVFAFLALRAQGWEIPGLFSNSNNNSSSSSSNSNSSSSISSTSSNK